jgi:dUTP pyrophosphatase
MELRYTTTSNYPLRFREGDAGIDLPTDSVNYQSNMIHTGYSFEIPTGHVGLLVPRSSAGTKRGFRLRNTVGVIDSSYRGEVMVAFESTFGRPWIEGEYLVQLVIMPVPALTLREVDYLSETERGEGGFGSTGGA